MKVLFSPREPSACAFYRIVEPAKHLAQHRGVEDCLLDLDKIGHAPGYWDILVVQRANRWTEKDMIARWQATGTKVVYDLDDDIFSVPSWTAPPIYAVWSNPDILAGAKACLRQANAITVSTNGLAEIIREYNTNIYILPNRINPSHFISRQPRERAAIVVGWMGSSTHYEDLMSIYTVIRDIIKARPHVTFRFLGYCPEPLLALGVQLFTNEPVTFYNLRDYPYRLAELSFDIGICPLMDHIFNRSKSNIKFLEMAACGIPVLASRGPCYGEDGYGLWLASDYEEWMTKLLCLIDSVDERNRLHWLGQRRLEDFHIRDDKYDRYAVYQKVLN